MTENASKSAVRLNIGAGDVDVPGFLPIDRDNGKEAYPLAYPDGGVDEIRASHILEHFGFKEAQEVLRDWYRALKPGGRIRIAVPNFSWIAAQYVARGVDTNRLFGYAMGGQTNGNDYHKSAWNETQLRNWLTLTGFTGIREWKSEVQDCASLDVSLNLEGYKPRHMLRRDLPQMIGVMSMPKLAFTENLFNMMQVCVPRKLDIIKNTGAFWGQCMERTMVEALETGAEWVFSCDYDTVATPDVFDRLCYLMAEHPEADAIAPWQIKREGDKPIIWMTTEEGKKRGVIPITEFDQEVIRVHSAHFGLTFFRAEALKRMPHPWFLAQPNANGEWGELRVDEDISFWNKWKDVGNSLYMACHVSIGHIQQVITWPTQDLGAIHQYVTDFQKHGMPMEARR
jgi:hypothetical protein